MSEGSDILALNPTAYWPLNDTVGSTSAADGSSNGHSAAEFGSVTFGVSATQTGDTDTGAQCTSATSGLTATASSVWTIGTSDFTAAVWVRFTSLPTSQVVLVGQGTSTSTANWYVGLNTAGKANFAFGTGSAVAGNSAINDGNWHLIVLRRKTNAITLSVDGVNQTATSTYSTAIGSSANGFGVLNWNSDAAAHSFGFLGVAKKAFFINGTSIADSSVTTLYADATSASAATAFTLTGSSTASVGLATTITVGPNGTLSSPETVIVTDDLSNTIGSFTFSSGAMASQSISWTPTSGQSGSRILTATSSPSLGSAPTLTVTVNSGSITVTTPSTFQVFQRSGTTGTIAISGSYTGSPTAIEANWSNNGSTYTTIVSSPSGGAFSTTLTGQPQGQGTLTVRFHNNTAINAGVSYVGIGEVFVAGGQSNAVGQGTNTQAYLHPTMKASLFGFSNTWMELLDPTGSTSLTVDTVWNNSGGAGGSYWPLVATQLMAYLKVPVAFVMADADGSGLVSSNGNGKWTPIPTNHTDRTTFYGSMVYRALLAGGVRAVLWHQGETDGIESVTQSAYTTGMAALAAAVASDLGCKLVPAKLQQGSAYPNIGPINLAIAAEWNGDANVLVGPDLSDLTVNADDVSGLRFKTNASLATVAGRWAQAVIAAFFAVVPSNGDVRAGKAVGYGSVGTLVGGGRRISF